MLQEQCENVIIQLNQGMADNMAKSLVLSWASVVQERPAAACVERTLSFDIKEFLPSMLVVHKQRSRSYLT